MYPYILFYRYRDNTVQIVRILHGKRDLRRILAEETEDKPG